MAELTRQDYGALALAGVVQAADLVNAIANGRVVDEAARSAVLAAITTHHAQSLEEVFADLSNYAHGIRVMKAALSGQAVTPEVARYTLHLIELAGRLQRNGPIAKQLGTLLDGLQDHPTSYGLGYIYEETIAKLGKRIQVTGEPTRLQQESTAADVRALLLGGVRFAWLWLQLGGRRWHLIVRRGKLLIALAELERKLKPH